MSTGARLRLPMKAPRLRAGFRSPIWQPWWGGGGRCWEHVVLLLPEQMALLRMYSIGCKRTRSRGDKEKGAGFVIFPQTWTVAVTSRGHMVSSPKNSCEGFLAISFDPSWQDDINDPPPT